MPPPQPPPQSWIDLTIQGSALTSNMLTPTVTINGYPVPTSYGLQQIPMPPGPVHIEASAQWMRRYGQAQLDFTLNPGQRVPVFYAAPWHQFTDGSMGHVQQQRKGAGAMIAMMAAIIAIIVLPLMLLLVLI